MKGLLRTAPPRVHRSVVAGPFAARPLEDERRLGRHAMPSDIRATGHPSRTVTGLGERATISSRSATVRTAWNHNRGPPASVMPASNQLKSSIWPELPLRGREHPAFRLRRRCLAVRQAPLAEGGELPDDGKLQQRRLDVRFYTNPTPALTGHSIVLQTRSMPAPTLAPWNTVSVTRR